MKQELPDLVHQLASTWQSLTAGQLYIIHSDEDLKAIADEVELPQKVQRAYRKFETILGNQYKSRIWWLLPLDSFAPGSSSLLAWASKKGPWESILSDWANLISAVNREKKVSIDLSAELVKAWDRLTFLYELTKIAGGSVKLHEMLESIVASLALVIGSGDVFLAIENSTGKPNVISSGQSIYLPSRLYQRLIEMGRPMSLTEVRALYDGNMDLFAEVTDLIIAPLVSSEEACGLLGFVNSEEGAYDANDAQLLSSVAEHVGALIEASQARRAREERERLERELSIAAEIQSNLLPIRLPEVKGCELAARLRPARRVGGDFYDIAHTRTGEPILMLADVAGKGMPAAILTAVVHATFHGEAPYQRDPAQLLADINRSIYADLEKAQAFVTAAVARIDTKPLRVAYASAGHVEAAVWHKQQGWIEFLPATGLPIGVQQFLSCRTRGLSLEPGDVFLLYSDGVTEAENPIGEVFGAQRLSDIIETIHSAKAEDQIPVIVKAVEVFCDSLPIRDDVTMLLLRATDSDDESQKVLPFILPSKISAISPFVEWAWQSLGLNLPESSKPGVIDEFALALSEVVTNQVEHAYRHGTGLIMGRLTLTSDWWQADLYDRGIDFESFSGIEFNMDLKDPPLHGYGLRLMRSLLNTCTYQRSDDERNHWHLFKNLNGE